MGERDVKSREQKCRKTLLKAGYLLRKSHARNWSHDNQQGYMIVQAATNIVVDGQNYTLSLEDVEDWSFDV